MPFIRNDEDGLEVDEDDGVTYTVPFDYYPAAEVAYEPRPFDPAGLPPLSAAAYSMLRTAGVVRFRVRYDGGHDEGFAHADAVWTADGYGRPIEQLFAEVSAATADDVRTALMAGAVPASPARADRYAKLTPDELLRRAVDDLADGMVSCLLGNGYGTGEYSMYGELTLDLTTDTLTDEPGAQRPPDVTFD